MTQDKETIIANILEDLKQDQTIPAFEKIESSIPLYPEDQFLWLYLTGIASLRENFPGKALIFLEKAHKIKPENSEIIDTLLVCSSLLGRLEDSLYYLKLGTNAKKTDIKDLYPAWLPKPEDTFLSITENLHIKSAKKYLQQGKIYKALEISKDFLTANPYDLDAQQNYAELLFLANRPFDAANIFQPILEKQPLSIKNLKLLTRILIDMAQCETAEALCEEYLARTEYFAEKNHLHRLKAEILNADLTKKLEEKIKEEKNLAKKINLHVLHSYEKKEKNNDGILRIGILSPSLAQETFTTRMATFLTSFKNSNCEIFFYLDSVKKDQITQWIKQFTRHLRFVHAIDDETLAYIMYQDNIDLLIDINSENSRIDRQEVILRRPATFHLLAFGNPETSSHWGYDAVLGDRWIYPTTQKEEDTNALFDTKTTCPTIRIRKGFFDMWDIVPKEIKILPQSPLLRLGIATNFSSLQKKDLRFIADCLESSNMVVIVHLQQLGGESAFQMLCDHLPCEEELINNRVFSFVAEENADAFFEEIDVLVAPCNAQIIGPALKNNTLLFASNDDLDPKRRLVHSFIAQVGLASVCIFSNHTLLKKKLEDLFSQRTKLEALRKTIFEKLNAEENKYRHQADKCILFFDDMQFCLKKRENHV